MLATDKVQAGIYEALKKVEKNLALYNWSTFPAAASVNHVYPPVANGDSAGTVGSGWTQGFWTGMLWLAYEMTSLDKFKRAAASHYFSFNDRLGRNDGLDHHDMGFLFSLSTGAQFNLNQDSKAQKATLKGADLLLKRFHEKGQFLQAWGSLGASDNYRLIIDCNMNVPLLMWAFEQTGNERYKEVAIAHWDTARKVIVRDNGSTHHTYFFDPSSGDPLYGKTAQGYNDESAWARGQAWGIYGFSLAYRYTQDKSYLPLIKKVTDFYIDHLPADFIPYWDLMFTESDGEERDTSSASIAVCGLQELLKHLPPSDPDYARYQDVLEKSLHSLIDHYTTRELEHATGLLTQAVYGKNPNGNGVNECCIWGDYFYMEALTNCILPHRRSYW